MKKVFSKKEKESIAEEAANSKNKEEVAVKYDIHISTLYDWINLFHKNKSRTVNIKIRLTEEEKEMVLARTRELGYGNNMSTYIRKILFSKNILVGDPKEVREELYRTRGEINKIGSNVNQIANYTNFLKANNYIEKDFIQDLIKETSELLKVCTEQRHSIDKAIRKIFR